jgi:HEAT repeat protein
VKELAATLTDENRAHRELAARALFELGAPPEVLSKELDALSASLTPEQMDRLEGAFAALGARVVPRATQLLADPSRRLRALRILGKIGADSAPAVPELVKLLKDADPQLKTGTLFVLAAIGPKADAGVGPAVELLSDADGDVRKTAGYYLGKMGPSAKAALPELKKWLASDDEMTRLTGVWAVLRIEPGNDELAKAAVPLLVKALTHQYAFVRVEAAMSLGDLGRTATSAVPALEAAAGDSHAGVRAAAKGALKKIKG